jgi:alkylhydroperoxidase family enzyme
MSPTEVSRIDLLSLEDARKAAEQAGIPAGFSELNVFRAFLHRPAIAKAISDLLLANFASELDHRLRELVIMRLGWATGSSYEWTQHWSIALERFGCTERDLLELRDWRRSEHFGAVERAVLTATDETIEHGAVSPETFAECAARLGSTAVCVDLVSAIGTWRLISQLLRSLDIPLEEGVAAWPPDGLTPPGVDA